MNFRAQVVESGVKRGFVGNDGILAFRVGLELATKTGPRGASIREIRHET
jgi:hypothetical protein